MAVSIHDATPITRADVHHLRGRNRERPAWSTPSVAAPWVYYWFRPEVLRRMAALLDGVPTSPERGGHGFAALE